MNVNQVLVIALFVTVFVMMPVYGIVSVIRDVRKSREVGRQLDEGPNL